MNDLSDIERMTYAEFSLRQKANDLRKLDIEYQIHLQAFANQQVQETDKKGNLKYPNFKSFFDYEKRQNEILGIEPQKSKQDRKIIELLKKANS